MTKLNLANLAQNEVTKVEEQRAKGGLVPCFCECVCICPPDYKMSNRWGIRDSEHITTDMDLF